MAVVQLTTSISPGSYEEHADYEKVLPEDDKDMPVSINSTESEWKRNKTPKRILHFSDGVLEEYSDEEQETVKACDSSALIDPRTLNWPNWLWYYVAVSGSKTLAVCDYMGEAFAWFFGITAPKYQYEIDEAHRMQKEKETEREEQEMEMAGWQPGPACIDAKQVETAIYPQELQVHTKPPIPIGKSADTSHVVVALSP